MENSRTDAAAHTEVACAYEVWVCQNRDCQQRGSAAVLDEFITHMHDHSPYQVKGAACQGQCNLGATVRVHAIADDTDFWYCRVQPEDVAVIVAQHLDQGKPLVERLHPRWHPRSVESRVSIDSVQ